MRPVKRYGVSKRKSAKTFRRHGGRSQAANFVMRGGLRF